MCDLGTTHHCNFHIATTVIPTYILPKIEMLLFALNMYLLFISIIILIYLYLSYKYNIYSIEYINTYNVIQLEQYFKTSELILGMYYVPILEKIYFMNE